MEACIGVAGDLFSALVRGPAGRYNGDVRFIAFAWALAVVCVAASSSAARIPLEPGEPEPLIPPAPAASWKLPMAFVSDGFRRGVFGDPDALAAKLRRAGMRSVALQIGEVSLQQGETFDRAGLYVLLWGIGDAGDHRGTLEAFASIVDGYILQIEDDPQYHAAVANLDARLGIDLPRAVVTTFEGVNTGHNGTPLYPERMARIRHAGITTAFVECYEQDGHADLGQMMRQAKIFQWPNPVPVIGLYGESRLRDYDQLSAYGSGWAFWRAEQIHHEDWQVLEGG